MEFSADGTHQLLRTQVYEYLRNELTEGALEPGMFISMGQLMKRLGMSRTPLRDALLQLQFEGFVTFLPQRGIRINQLTKKDIEDIYEMIGGLESRALLSVFPRIGTAEIQRMKDINRAMYAQLTSKSITKYWQFNTDFHHVYLDLSTNAVLVRHLNTLRRRLLEFGKREWNPQMRENNYEEHLTLVALIEKGNAVEAADYIRDVHLVINFELF